MIKIKKNSLNFIMKQEVGPSSYEKISKIQKTNNVEDEKKILLKFPPYIDIKSNFENI
jgi:hypothetical protein